jgi:hypothetical protein
MKNLTDFQTNRAKALAIELAAINRYPMAYMMRTAVKLLFWTLTPTASAALGWRLWHVFG